MTRVVETAIRSVVSKGVTALAAFNRGRMRAPGGPHPFLTGIHAPMTEERTIEDLAVPGSTPPALDGRYLRIGPNPITADPRSYHWFLGDGLVHARPSDRGRARGRDNRWRRST